MPPKTKDATADNRAGPADTSFDFSYHSEKRQIRRLHPLGLRVVVRSQRDANVTDSGLYLPEGAKEAMQESKEHLLVSKALPLFLAPHYFCACSDLHFCAQKSYEALNRVALYSQVGVP